MEDRRSAIRDPRFAILGLCFVAMRLLRSGKNLLIGSSSSLAHRRVPNNESGRGDRASCQAGGHEEAPTPGGVGARAAGAGVALATAEQDSRRRATSQVIQRSTAKQVAVR